MFVFVNQINKDCIQMNGLCPIMLRPQTC